jgi:hypothetical protein
MMPPVAYTDDDLFDLEEYNYVLNVPYNLLDYYSQLIEDRPRVNDEEYW